MTRKCSHCGHNGHNSRTCPNRDRGGVKLFGVRLTDGPIRKSASLGNLLMINNNPPSPSPSPSASACVAADPAGYLSDGLLHPSTSSISRERKKGVPWTEEEHRMFLLGLRKLGKGDWRGISRNFVITRTPTQVASHAQKYFIRQSNMTRRKRRSSLFDMITEGDHDNALEVYSMVTTVDPICEGSVQNQLLPGDQNSMLKQDPNFEHNNLGMLSSRSASDQECETVDSANSTEVQNQFPQGSVQMACIPPAYPTFVGQSLPIPVPFWPVFRPNPNDLPPNSNIFKPRAEVPKAPVNIDELTGISQLSIGEPAGPIEPSALSLKLLSKPSRQSAFHTNPSLNNSSLSPINPIHVA
ncbi:hypothetical protein SUGI_0609010 [Cryptomeria japonica]|uniref:transcription factor MYBS3 n=1 Tax=Cryptomeria japonica TaxID=3369 RepID=UPI0024149DC2|nr:transcription factor MYBS3 [Cryptomeria japonica]GLJ30729.1 hypothetical protein SUGI_0609010 [Cryptomeria japonica]